jgi:hypothetical protein
MNIFNIKKIPTIIGLIVLVIGLGTGIILINGRQIFGLNAKEESSPKNVRISNINESSFCISWTTIADTKGFVKWGEKERALNQTALDRIDPNTKTKNHYIIINNLNISKNYYFIINSDGFDYNNNNLPWQTQTGNKLSLPDSSNIIYGSVLTSSGQPEKKAIVYVSAGGGSLLSTISEEDGSWVIPLSSIRSKELNFYVQIDETKTVVEILIQSGIQIAAATIYPVAAKPVPPITLGRTYDFKNLTREDVGNTPNANIELSENGSLKITPTATPEESVTINNPREGEIISSFSPEFSGEAPPGKSVTITVESENPITGVIQTDTSGNWNWKPQQNLEPGTHSITLTWEGENGIQKSIKREFTVEAQNLSTATPSFTSVKNSLQTSENTTSKLNFLPKGLSGINFTLTILAVVGAFIIFLFLIVRKRKVKNVVNQEPTKSIPNVEGPKGSLIGSSAKIFIFLGVLILIAAGVFSIYQLYKNQLAKKGEEPKIAQLNSPSPTISLPTISLPTPTPTPSVYQILITAAPSPTIKLISPTPTVSRISPTPTLRPTSTPTVRLIPSPSPTPTVKALATPAPTAVPKVKIATTQTPIPTKSPELPVSGTSFPTVILGLGGILLIIISLALLVI